MNNPPHPGEFITEVYLAPSKRSGRELATNLDVSASTLNRILKGTSGFRQEMALRLAKALGRSAESWLAMQSNYDLWQARQHVKLGKVRKVRLTTAESMASANAGRICGVNRLVFFAPQVWQ